MLIADAENALIDRVKRIFGTRLKAVESIPADWDDETFKRLLHLTPGVFVVFAGGSGKSPQVGPTLIGRFSFVVATTHASGEKARRHGDAREIGAYEIIEILARTMHGYTLDDIGTLSLDQVENLYTGSLDNQGAAVYAVAFSLPLSFGSELVDGELDDFLTYRDDFDLAPVNNQIDAQDLVHLPAATQ